MRLIDAERLEEILRSRCAQCSNDYGSLAGAISGCLKLVQSQPTITPDLATEVGRMMYIIERYPMTVFDVEIYARFCEDTALHGKNLSMFLQEAIADRRRGFGVKKYIQNPEDGVTE